MQFNTPEVVAGIRDISEIYKMNDTVGSCIDEEIKSLEDDIFIESCGEQKLGRIEKLLGICPKDTDGMEMRRFAVMTGISDRKTYNMDGLKRKIEALCGKDNYRLYLDFPSALVHLSLTLAAKNCYESVMDMLDEQLPLNMAIEGEILYHTYEALKSYTYGELADYECGQIREI